MFWKESFNSGLINMISISLKKSLYTLCKSFFFVKLGSFDLSIISIGAYKPRGMMQASHCTPEEAVEITSMLISKNILGMHWGTIRLSAEDPWEPPIKFKKAAQLRGYQQNQIWQLAIGQTKSLI